MEHSSATILVQTSQCTVTLSQIFCDMYVTSFGERPTQVLLSAAKFIAGDGSEVRGFFLRYQLTPFNTLNLVLQSRERQTFSIRFPVTGIDPARTRLAITVAMAGKQKVFNDYSLPIRKIR